mgnify:CR=1 FL=1
MTISRFIAVPVLAGLSLAISLALLPIQADAPDSSALALSETANPV